LDEPPSYIPIFISLGSGVLYILLAALFIFLTSLASATEAAFFSLHADDLERLRNSASAREKNVAALQTSPRLLLTMLTAWRYAMMSATAVIFVFFLLRHRDYYHPSSVIVATSVLTIVFTFFGVIIPKVYGRAHNVRISTAMAALCQRLIPLCAPLLKPLLKMSYKVEGKLEKIYEQTSAQELNRALQLASVNKETSEDEKEILQGIVDFGTLSVKQVMRLRADISCVDVSLSYRNLMEHVRKSGYSRIPVCRNSLDSIQGVLYVKDLLPFLDEPDSFPWQKLIRPAYFALETRKIDHLLKDFQEKRVHLALVVDEFGTLTGLITLEDIIEEIIGDINDEFDEIGSHFQKIDSRTFIFDGKTSMHDFCKILHVDCQVFGLTETANISLGGMLKDIHGALPKPGEALRVKSFTFTVEKMDNRRIKKVRVQLHESRPA
jgi:gliding motility-associated protein GldE